jgi:pimeloyl-ACP methyl ester carboxylesterase
MPKLDLGTFEIHYEESGGRGDPVVLVHGSLGDHHQWDGVASRLSASCHVLSYDRRGHGASSSPAGSVALADQVADLATLLSIAGHGASHIVGNGVGGTIALQLALLRPELVRSLHVHEPSLLGLLSADARATETYAAARAMEASVAGHLRSGDAQGGAQAYVDGISLEPGSWNGLPPVVQSSFVANAGATLRELSDPTTENMEIARFASYRDPVLVTGGTKSAPVFAAINERVVDAFYRANQHSYEGAGHLVHITHPDGFAQLVSQFCQYAAALPAQ